MKGISRLYRFASFDEKKKKSKKFAAKFKARIGVHVEQCIVYIWIGRGDDVPPIEWLIHNYTEHNYI